MRCVGKPARKAGEVRGKSPVTRDRGFGQGEKSTSSPLDL